MNRTQLLATTIAAALGLSVGASAQAGQIGFINPADGLTYWADVWTSVTDTGVDRDESGDGNPTNFPVGEPHSFHTQLRVGSFSSSSIPPIGSTTPPGLNTTFEITKEVYLNDAVIASSPVGVGGYTVIFGSGPGTGSMTIYYDDLTNGGSQANPGTIPGPAAGTVACYGDGTGTVLPVNPCASDGVPILQLTLLNSSSVFTATTPGAGLGSFDLNWEITWYDPALITFQGLGQGSILRERLTGSLVQPLGGIPLPTTSWDGVPAVNGCAADGRCTQIFKVDSSETDFVRQAPEPSSIALLGAGLLGLARVFRKKKV